MRETAMTILPAIVPALLGKTIVGLLNDAEDNPVGLVLRDEDGGLWWTRPSCLKERS